MGSMSSSACSPPSVRGSSTTGAPRMATAPRTPPVSGKPWTLAGRAGDRAKEHSVGPPRGARTPEPVHPARGPGQDRSEEHTSELQSRPHLVCRLLLEKKKDTRVLHSHTCVAKERDSTTPAR